MFLSVYGVGTVAPGETKPWSTKPLRMKPRSKSTRSSSCRQRSNPNKENISSSLVIPSENINPIKSPNVISIGATPSSNSHSSSKVEPAGTSNSPITNPSNNAALRITRKSTVKSSKHSSHSLTGGSGSGAGGAVAYPDERAMPTNAPSADPNR